MCMLAQRYQSRHGGAAADDRSAGAVGEPGCSVDVLEHVYMGARGDGKCKWNDRVKLATMEGGKKEWYLGVRLKYH